MYPAVLNLTSFLSHHSVPATTAEHLVLIASKIGGPIAEAVAARGAELFTRVAGGDQRLHAEIDQNREMQRALAANDPGNAARTFGEYVEATGGGEMSLPEWAKDWREKRSEQKESGKRMIQVAYKATDKPVFGQCAELNNYANQSCMGFEGTTKKFKKDHNIKDYIPLASWMNKDQLHFRDLMSRKLTKAIESMENPTASQISAKAKEIRDKFKDMCDYSDCLGFDREHYEKKVMRLENNVKRVANANKKLTERVAALEARREHAESSVKQNTIVSFLTNIGVKPN